MRWGGFALSALVVCSTAACADSEPTSGHSATDASSSPMSVDAGAQHMDSGLHGDAVTPETACVRCPSFLLGAKCPFDLSAQPGYDETRQEWLAECPAPDSGRLIPEVSEARCASSGLRYVQIELGLGSKRRYFDADGGFISADNTTDVVDPICDGTFSWPARAQCQDQTDRKILCGTLQLH
jgi:hypothetical protein